MRYAGWLAGINLRGCRLCFILYALSGHAINGWRLWLAALQRPVSCIAAGVRQMAMKWLARQYRRRDR